VPALLREGVSEAQVKSYVEQVTPIVNKGLAIGYRLATGKDAFLTAQVLHYARLALAFSVFNAAGMLHADCLARCVLWHCGRSSRAAGLLMLNSSDAMQVALGLYIISKVGRAFTVVGWLYTGALSMQLHLEHLCSPLSRLHLMPCEVAANITPGNACSCAHVLHGPEDL